MVKMSNILNGKDLKSEYIKKWVYRKVESL